MTPITPPGSSSTAPAGASGPCSWSSSSSRCPDADTRALAEADAGGELREELAQLLGERTGGNPYFVGEAIRDLRERGALERENGRLTLVGPASIPAALQEALQARIGRLDGEARELLTTAAVIGRSFGLPVLERLLPRARLLPTLSELQWLQLVVEERSGTSPEYRFRHGLVQEAAYGSLVEARRRELHLLVGEALVELNRESPRGCMGCSLTTSPKPTSPSVRSSTCSRRATPPARATQRKRRSTSTGARSRSWSEPATKRRPARRCSRSRSLITSPSTTTPRTEPSARHSCGLRPNLRGSSPASESRGR